MRTYQGTIVDNLSNHTSVLRSILSARGDDISEFDNLKNTFMSGRKVGKVPTESADIAAADRAGDFNYDEDYLYLFTGTDWRRLELLSW